MEVTFRGYARYGKLDSVDFDVCLELTDEEYERLRASCKDHWSMQEDESISDIYDEAYKVALDIDVDNLRWDKEMLAERMAWHLDIPEEEAAKREYTDEEIIEMLEAEATRGIDYPEELEEEFDFEE